MNADATGINAVSIGHNSDATAAGAIALGGDSGDPGTLGAQAIGVNAVAIGSDSVASTTNAVALGTLGRAPIAMEGFMKGPSAAEMIALSGEMGMLKRDLDEMKGEFRDGIAASVAMTPVQIPSEPGRFSYALNGAAYRGAYATGGSMMYRLPTKAPMAVGFGFSRAGGKNSAVRVGIAGEF